MGRPVIGALARTLGWTDFGFICVLTVAAPSLLIVPNGGAG